MEGRPPEEIAPDSDSPETWDSEYQVKYEDTQDPQESFKRINKEFKEGRLSLNQAVADVVAVLAGDVVERHAVEDDPEYLRKREEAEARERAEAAQA